MILIAKTKEKSGHDIFLKELYRDGPNYKIITSYERVLNNYPVHQTLYQNEQSFSCNKTLLSLSEAVEDYKNVTPLTVLGFEVYGQV